MESGYKKLAIILPVNAVLMFLLTYTLIDTWDHFYPNINRAYMAIVMVAPMTLVMMLMMRSMYPNTRLNLALYALLVLVFLGVFSLARTQTGVGNEAFLRSMIPHHSSAILMCERASLSDPDIIRLCDQIIQSQKEEIARMEDLLERY